VTAPTTGRTGNTACTKPFAASSRTRNDAGLRDRARAATWTFAAAADTAAATAKGGLPLAAGAAEPATAAVFATIDVGGGATLRRVRHKRHIVERHNAVRHRYAAAARAFDEQAAAESGAAATAANPGAAHRDRILDCQVFERDIAGIDKEAALVALAVDCLDLCDTPAGAVCTHDRQRRAAHQVDREQLRGERDVGGDRDHITGVRGCQVAADIDVANIGIERDLRRCGAGADDIGAIVPVIGQHERSA
jgi:hypothetical protein